MMARLPAQAVITNRGAYYIHLKLRPGWSAEAFTQAAEDNGVGVAPFSLFEISSLHHTDAVRVSVNAAPDRESLADALVKLRGLLDTGAPATARRPGTF